MADDMVKAWLADLTHAPYEPTTEDRQYSFMSMEQASTVCSMGDGGEVPRAIRRLSERVWAQCVEEVHGMLRMDGLVAYAGNDGEATTRAATPPHQRNLQLLDPFAVQGALDEDEEHVAPATPPNQRQPAMLAPVAACPMGAHDDARADAANALVRQRERIMSFANVIVQQALSEAYCSVARYRQEETHMEAEVGRRVARKGAEAVVGHRVDAVVAETADMDVRMEGQDGSTGADGTYEGKRKPRRRRRNRTKSNESATTGETGSSTKRRYRKRGARNTFKTKPSSVLPTN